MSAEINIRSALAPKLGIRDPKPLALTPPPNPHSPLSGLTRITPCAAGRFTDGDLGGPR